MAGIKTFAKRLLGLRRVILHVDRPTPGETISGSLKIDGWAFAEDGLDVSVRVSIDGIVRAEVAPSVARKDVTRPGGGEAGFSVVLERSQVATKTGPVVLDVDAFVSGASGLQRLVRAASRIPLNLNLEPPVPVARGDYGTVWDAASATEANAHDSVYGAADAAEFERSGRSTADDVVSLTAMQLSDNVLEIGCGVGRVGLFLSDRCSHWTGADVSERMLAYARESFRARSTANVSFVKLNGYDLTGIGAESLDIVYCTGVFMHLDEWDRYRYVTEAFRVLKRGGRLYIDNLSLTSPQGWQVFLDVAALDPRARPANTSKSSTPIELETYVHKAGFTEVRTRVGDLWVTVTGVKDSRMDATATRRGPS